MKHAIIHIRTEEPDCLALPKQDFDWTCTICGDAKELKPKGAPEPLGKPVTLTRCINANLFHCMIAGRSVTGILHLVNKTPIDWCSEEQSTDETATCGSEFVAACTCTEQSVDSHNMLHCLGVPVSLERNDSCSVSLLKSSGVNGNQWLASEGSMHCKLMRLQSPPVIKDTADA